MLVEICFKRLQVITDVSVCLFLCLRESAMDFESRLGTMFHHANTKRPEEITLREEVASRKFTLLEANEDFGSSPFYFNFSSSPLCACV